MPQVEETLRSSGVLLPGMELSIYNPERSIVEGAALYAGMIQIPEIAPVRPAARPAQKPSARSTAPAPEPAPSPAQKERLIQRIAPHGYGVVCAVPERGGDPMIRILIRKGDPLPARAVSVSVVPNRSALARKRSLIRICETDAITESPDPEYPEEGTYITIGSARLAELWQGREIFEAELLRNIPAPVGARTVQILTLNEDLTLGLEVTDNFSGRIIRNQNITIRATSVDLGDGEE